MTTTQTDRNNSTPVALQNDRASGLRSSTAFKGPCKVLANTNITLAGEQTINAIACVDGDRVLVTGKTDQTLNGIYVVSTGEWQRAADFNRNDDVVEGTAIRVTRGDYAGIWVLTTEGDITFGSSNLTFEQSDVGPTGATGPAPTIEVGTTTTLAPGESAVVEVGGTPESVILNFSIPAGAGATVTIGTVTTIDAGLPATVTNVGTETEVILDFEIPRGPAGPGSGDLLAANNLSELVSKPTSRTNLGLGNVDDTSDANKPVSTATQTALNLKLDAASFTKANIGLGNVDNTSDATKNSATATLTNKRITKRIVSVASSGTPTPDGDTTDQYVITALAAAAAFGAPTGTPTDGQPLIIRIKDNGTARALTWDAIYRALAMSLPATTTISKTIYLGFLYNSADTKWDLVAYTEEY